MENMEVYKQERWMENPSQYFREAGKYQDIFRGRNSHNGWYINPYYYETSYGIVFQLTSKKRKTRFIAGCSDGDNDEYFKINVRDVFDTKEDAARESNEIARLFAEHSMEEYIKEHAKNAIEENELEIKELKVIIKKTCFALRNDKKMWMVSMSEIIKNSVISDIRRKVKEISELRKIIKKYKDNPYWWIE